MKIYGAGLAGLLAAHHFQKATIFEAQSKSMIQHKAVLRFRTPDVGNAVGIDFRKVRVHKAIWKNGFVSSNILHANNYSMKVAGRLIDRSIWNLAPVDRYIAPEDFVEQLLERCADRIHWGRRISAADIHTNKSPIISTIPMDIMWEMAGDAFHPPAEFYYKDISIRHWRIPGADVYQTIYFPNPSIKLYRASITGDMLIAEYINDLAYPNPQILESAFGIKLNNCTELVKSHKDYGKITPIDDTWRKQFQYELTTKYNIYSLGRFATWRNLLLDDVLKDIIVIKKLMKMNSSYERSKANVTK